MAPGEVHCKTEPKSSYKYEPKAACAAALKEQEFSLECNAEVIWSGVKVSFLFMFKVEE